MRYSRWDQRFDSRSTNDICLRLSTLHASRLTAEADREHVTSCIASNNVLDLCNLSVAYEESTVHDAIQLRQINAFFSKRADLDFGVDREAVAFNAFKASEVLCRETNSIFRERASGSFLFEPDVESRLFRAQQKIARILGDVPNLSDLKIRFGPGATTNVQKRMASPKRKLSEPLACSKELIPMLSRVLEELQGYVFSELPDDVDSVTVPVEIHTGKLAFVPKNFKTFRGIVVEPSVTGMVQNGIGSYMSRRLRKFGIDLKDQSRNQRLALEGSLTGALATLDLSSASDTIASLLVLDLLPYDWCEFLGYFRSGSIAYKDEVFELEKFSSMGNGFTFPLESLIFYALACACVNEEDEHIVSVYGDDIIVPTYAFETLCRVLHCVGFIPNKEKSFSTGPFRESCGADYLKGNSIRPSYLKDALSAFDVFRLHNQYVRRGDQEAADLLLDYLDPTLIRWGPDGYGDGHLISDDPVHLSPHGRRHGWSGYTFETYTFAPKRDFTVLPGDRVYPFYSIYDSNDWNPERSEPQKSYHHGELARRLGDLPLDEVVVMTPSAVEYDRKGRLGVSIPGRGAYRLIRVYVLAS